MSTAIPEALSVRVERKTKEADRVQSFALVAADGRPLPAFSAGSHIDVAVADGVTRQYSLCNDPSDPSHYLIAVLNDPRSRGGSIAMHESVAEGDVLTISAPKNHFALAHPLGRSLLLAGGIGITPLLCMADRLAMVGADFALHYAARTRSAMAFRERIASARWSSRACLYFDDEPGRIDLDALLAVPASDRQLYVCGPNGFIDAVLGAADAAGWARGCVHHEFFGSDIPAVPDAAAGDGFEIVVASSGKVVRVGRDTTVVEALRAAGIDIPTSCEQGVCGTCATRVLDGEPDHRDLYLSSDEQVRGDQFMPCVSRAKTRRLTLDL